jgi:hypothetical protein
VTRIAKRKIEVLRDLGDGLILRRAAPTDTATLVEFNAEVHCGSGSDEPRPPMVSWIRDLMSGAHPTFRPQDFTIVQDTNTGEIVSSLCLIPQRWSYEGVEFGVGLPELVGTKSKYRRRGLVRAQFEVVHEWSARRGHRLQAIGGIPNFYRRFGYEMVVELHGGRAGGRADVPKLKKGVKEPYRVRSATQGDLPFIARVYRHGMKRYLLSAVRDSALWRYELDGRRKNAVERRELQVIETAAGERIGMLVQCWEWWEDAFGASAYELKPGTSWLAVTPSVVRHLVKTGEQRAARKKKKLHGFTFSLGTQHPVYEVMPWRLPRTRPPYAFYIRVPDVPAFLGRVKPVLEQRLAESVAVGYTGDLKLSFYRDGLRLRFQRGRLAEVEPWQPERGESAAFPGLTFLHLLFGHRSLDDLKLAYTDCYARTDEARLLLKVLFPKKPSSVWTVA